MEPARTYDYLTRARQQVFQWVRPLTSEQWIQEFPIGPGSLARTLTHALISEWYYIKRLREEHVPPYTEWPIRDEAPPPFLELEHLWQHQSDSTRTAIAAVRDWDQPLEYQVTDDAGQKIHVTATKGDIFTQLILHEVHHRAQVLNMLRQLRVKLEDIDYNAIMYTRRTLPS